MAAFISQTAEQVNSNALMEISPAGTANGVIIMANNTTERAKPTLATLPTEIIVKIAELVCQRMEPINPKQLKERSNIFLLDIDEIVLIANDNAEINLSLTCRRLYEVVNSYHPFYRRNHFDFKGFISYRHCYRALTYLVAITPDRRNSLRSVSCSWGRLGAADTFTMLGTCASLEDLKIKLNEDDEWWFERRDISKLNGYRQLSLAVRGLKKLEFVVVRITDCHRPWRAAIPMRSLEKIGAKLDSEFQGYTKLPRNTAFTSQNKIQDAKSNARLDVIGEGRAGPDKKPGIVSSRTRQGLKDAATLKVDGTKPVRPVPTFDSEGVLTGWIGKILQSRIVQDGEETVEFRVKCAYAGKVISEGIWAIIAQLQCRSHWCSILEFYKSQPHKLEEMQIVLDEWKLRHKKKLDVQDYDPIVKAGVEQSLLSLFRRTSARKLTEERRGKKLAKRAVKKEKASARKAKAAAKKANRVVRRQRLLERTNR